MRVMSPLLSLFLLMPGTVLGSRRRYRARVATPPARRECAHGSDCQAPSAADGVEVVSSDAVMQVLKEGVDAFNKGLRDAAAVTLARAFRMAPFNSEVLRLYGTVLNQEERWPKLLELATAGAIDRRNPTHAAWIGQALFHGGRLEEAVGTLRLAATLGPDNAAIWGNLGTSVSRLWDESEDGQSSRWTESMYYTRRGLALAPTSEAGW